MTYNVFSGLNPTQSINLVHDWDGTGSQLLTCDPTTRPD